MIEEVANLLDLIQRDGLEQFGRYYSTYRAKVTDNKDPKKRGRVRLVVPSIFGDGDPESKSLDWADPRDFRNASKTGGEFFPPEIGDWVYVEFETGDLQFPIYSGGYFAENELPSEFTHSAKNEPQVRGYKNKRGDGFYFDETKDKEKLVFTTKGGHTVVLDDTKDKESIFIKHKSGAQFQVNEKGSVNIFAKNGSVFAMNAEKNSITLQNQTGALVQITKDFNFSTADGKTLLTMKNKKLQAVTNGDFIVQAATNTMTAGATTIGDKLSKLVLGNGKIALGTPAAELVDLLIQTIDAILNDPAPYVTAVGPTSPLLGTSKAFLTKIKLLLTTIKGSL
jgi:Type VI secretion system/phage-baseplate injector OB domain